GVESPRSPRTSVWVRRSYERWPIPDPPTTNTSSLMKSTLFSSGLGSLRVNSAIKVLSATRHTRILLSVDTAPIRFPLRDSCAIIERIPLGLGGDATGVVTGVPVRAFHTRAVPSRQDVLSRRPAAAH